MPPETAWRWPPGITMQDAALAAKGAMLETFAEDQPDDVEEESVIFGMCFVHVLRWLDASDRPWKNRKENRPKMREDLNTLNSHLSPRHCECLPHLLKLLEVKWTKNYGERAVAVKFFSMWGDENFTRAQLNVVDKGGIPSDNNALEGKNGAQVNLYRTEIAEIRNCMSLICPAFTCICRSGISTTGGRVSARSSLRSWDGWKPSLGTTMSLAR